MGDPETIVAEILTVSPEQPEQPHVERAVELLWRGEVVGIPTDTLYGLAADPFNLAAVTAIYKIKGRPERKALPILIAEVGQARDLAREMPDIFYRLAEKFWPGPFTVVVDASSRLPFKITGQTGRVALRIPDARIPCAVIRAFNRPVTGTSANLAGHDPCMSAAEVAYQIGDRVPLILDGGETPGFMASTVVDVRGDQWRILREGPIHEADIREALE